METNTFSPRRAHDAASESRQGAWCRSPCPRYCDGEGAGKVAQEPADTRDEASRLRKVPGKRPAAVPLTEKSTFPTSVVVLQTPVSVDPLTK
jgi:hypothetical protein